MPPVTETQDQDQPTLLDAIEAGISDANGDESESANEPSSESPEPAAKADEPQGDEPAESSNEPSKDEEKPEAKDEAAEKPAEEKKPDPVEDPIPEDVKGRTRERIESLVSRVKETSEKLTHVESQYNSIMGMIAETKATPEQYGMVLDYLGAVNSGDETQIRGAIKVLNDELKALYERIGEPQPGTDVLAAHQDLRDAVEVGDITEAHAKELALARARAAASERRAEAQRAQQTATTEQTQAIAQGRADLNNLETQLRASDPQYDAKRAVLIETLKPVMARIHPSQWAETFREAYKHVRVAAPTPKPSVVKPQPLRARQPAGGQQKAASSLEEAISMGIDAASRR